MEKKFLLSLPFSDKDCKIEPVYSVMSPNAVDNVVIRKDGITVHIPQDSALKYVEELCSDTTPTLKRTVTPMLSSDFKQRFVAEYLQLKYRLNGLSKMLLNWDERKLGFEPTCPRETYDLQIRAMDDYLKILTIRAKIEGIELPE